MAQKKIAVYVWNGVEELDFAGPYEVLTASGADVVTVADTRDPICCAHGLQVVPDVTWEELDGVDVFLMPGGRTNELVADDGFVARVRALAERGTLMTSVCTGAHIYAKAGLLDGRPATTHWSGLDSLGELGRDVDVRPDARFVDDGEIITAAGVSAGIDMALHLVARLESTERAREVRRYIQYDPQPPV